MIRRIAGTVVLATGIAACAYPISLENRFYQTAFYYEEYEVEERLLKRSTDMLIFVEGATEDDRVHIRLISRQIAEATGLEVSETTNGSKANVRIRFVTDQQWAAYKRMRDEEGLPFPGYSFSCTVTFFGRGSGRPSFFIRIPQSHPASERRACVAQELGHTTGLLNDVNGAYDSVFGGWAGSSELTEVDYKLLRILYDPRLVNGMSWEEAKPHVQAIIREMEAGQGS